jgi:hypothetical protein
MIKRAFATLGELLTTRWIIVEGLAMFAIAAADGRLWLQALAAGLFVLVGLLYSLATYCKYLDARRNGSAEPPAAPDR